MGLVGSRCATWSRRCLRFRWFWVPSNVCFQLEKAQVFHSTRIIRKRRYQRVPTRFIVWPRIHIPRQGSRHSFRQFHYAVGRKRWTTWSRRRNWLIRRRSWRFRQRWALRVRQRTLLQSLISWNSVKFWNLCVFECIKSWPFIMFAFAFAVLKIQLSFLNYDLISMFNLKLSKPISS